MRRTWYRRAASSLGDSATAALASATTLASRTDNGNSASTISPEKQAFLNEFRAKLAVDRTGKSELDGFVDTAPTPISAASVGPIQRGREPLPSWLKLKIPKGSAGRPKYNRILQSMKNKKLSTVCQEAKCPNIGECWGGGDGHEAATATIMLMGAHCTRGCRFCSVMTSRTPPPLDPEEPEKTADAIREMGVDYIVMTMVDRDDLPDGGATHVKRCIERVKEKSPKMLLEALVGDFRGRNELVELVASSPLNVYAHNVECVERITPNVRDRRATYRQSLSVLEHAAKFAGDRLLTKSSIMLGLGEQEAEVRQTLRDLRSVGVSAVTLGQYLQPSRTRLKVSRYAHPDEFAMWEKEALAMGFVYCASGPMVRSSYRAGEFYLANYLRQKEAAAARVAESRSETMTSTP